MSDLKDLYRRVDAYIEKHFARNDEILSAALQAAQDAGLPAINVSANEGRLLYLLARICGARRILEIGTLGAYSTIWLARALPPDGRILSLELSAPHAAVARANLERAGLSAQAEIRVGAATASLDAMIARKEAPFDLVFIDADKANYPAYLAASLALTRSGSLILADNVIRNGRILESGGDADLVGIQTFNQRLAADPRLEGVLLPIFRENLDGLAVARVK